MKIVKLIQTFKDGVLTASKKVAVLNPETDKPYKAPKHHKVLDLADAAQLSFNNAQQSFDTLKEEIRRLRKALIVSERAISARTKERNALKKAYLRRSHQNDSLKEKNEELEAKLFAVKGDFEFLEERMRALTARQLRAPRVITAKPDTSIATPTNNTKPETNTKPPATEINLNPPTQKVRSIAAKPVKKR